MTFMYLHNFASCSRKVTLRGLCCFYYIESVNTSVSSLGTRSNLSRQNFSFIINFELISFCVVTLIFTIFKDHVFTSLFIKLHVHSFSITKLLYFDWPLCLTYTNTRSLPRSQNTCRLLIKKIDTLKFLMK